MRDKSNDIVSAMYKGIELDVFEQPPEWALPFDSPPGQFNFSGLLMRIHFLVRDISKSSGPAFTITESAGAQKAVGSSISVGVTGVKECASLVSRLEYSEQANAFLLAWRRLGLDGFRYWPDSSVGPGEELLVAVNRLVEELRAEVQSTAFRARVRIRRERANNNARSAARFLAKAFSNSSVRVLRMDLGYFDASVAWPSESSALLLATDMKRFVNRMSKRTGLFSSLIGHLAFLGAGVGKRDYYHVIFFFNTLDAVDDQALSAEIGRFWQQIVANQEGRKGLYFDCRNSANAYKRKGIGLIGSEDKDLKKRLGQCVYFLAKCSEYIRLASHQNRRLFSASHPRKKAQKISKSTKQEAQKLGL
jgi:hypothetical protein